MSTKKTNAKPKKQKPKMEIEELIKQIRTLVGKTAVTDAILLRDHHTTEVYTAILDDGKFSGQTIPLGADPVLIISLDLPTKKAAGVHEL